MIEQTKAVPFSQFVIDTAKAIVTERRPTYAEGAVVAMAQEVLQFAAAPQPNESAATQIPKTARMGACSNVRTDVNTEPAISASAAAPLPLSARDIELILACLGDGTYTRQEASDFRSMGQQALRAIELEAENNRMRNGFALDGEALRAQAGLTAIAERERDNARAELARYRKAERELPEDPSRMLLNEARVWRSDYNRLRTIATVAVARAEKMRALIVNCLNDLAEWIVPDSGISDHEILGRLLGRLDGPEARSALTAASCKEEFPHLASDLWHKIGTRYPAGEGRPRNPVRDLERGLTAANAEIERLRAELEKCRPVYDELRRAVVSQREQAALAAAKKGAV